MISVDHPALAASPFVLVQDPAPQGGDQGAPPVLRREDAPPPVTGAGGEGSLQDPQQQRAAPQGCFDTQTLPILIGFVAIFYFLILRPQQKTEKQRKAMLAAVKKGERVVTNSGIHGEITALSDETVTIRVDQNVQLTFDRAAIGRVLSRDDAGTGDKS